MGAEKNFWVYILLCENNCYYTGYTVDLVKRYRAHVQGRARCKYTQSFKPVSLVQCWEIVGSKTLAMQVEYYVKKLSRAAKEKMIAEPMLLQKKFLSHLIKPACIASITLT